MTQPSDWPATFAGVFDRAAPTYEALGVDFFSVFGVDLVADAQLKPGERVLDVGCGRGACLFPAAAAVGAGGRVVGVDLAPGMVAATADDAEQRGLDHVEVVLGDAQQPPVTGPFDVVLAGMVMFFLPDPAAALRAYARLLRPGGRVALSTLGPDDPKWAWLAVLSRTTGGPRLPTRSGPFASTDALHALLGPAGFVDARTLERVHETRFADPDQWWRWTWSVGLRAAWEQLPEARLEQVRQVAHRKVAAMAGPDGSICLRSTLWNTLATRP